MKAVGKYCALLAMVLGVIMLSINGVLYLNGVTFKYQVEYIVFFLLISLIGYVLFKNSAMKRKYDETYYRSNNQIWITFKG